jgi:hypothetical protein
MVPSMLKPEKQGAIYVATRDIKLEKNSIEVQ